MKLPEGWAEAGLLDIADLHDSRRIPLNAAQRAAIPGDYPYYGANGQVGTVGKYLFEGRHILLAEDGGYFDQPERGVAYEADGRFWVNNHAHILSTCADMPSGYITRLLNTVEWLQYVSGTTRLKLTQAGMQRVNLTVPPLAEQRRIVAKLDVLTARLARARAELHRVPVLAAKLRASALDRLLDFGPDAVFTTLEALGRWGSGGTPKSTESSYYDGPIPWLRSGDLPDGPVVGHERTITEAGLAASAAKWVPAGSVLIAMYGATIGKLGVTTYRTTTNQAVAAIEPNPAVDRDWLFYSLLRLRPTLIALGQGGAQPNISQQILKALPIALPDVAAQRMAATAVNAAFARADRLEAEAARARALIDRLESAILAKAFRGELVPQDPNDEPASVLLDRIRAQRAAAPKPKRGRRAAMSA